MGQKVSPHGLRVGIIKDWDSVWYAEKDFAKLLLEDNVIRKYIKKKLYQAGISKVVIHRSSAKVKIQIHVNKPGFIIGRNGQAIQELTAEIQKLIKNPATKAQIDIAEIRYWERDAQLVAEDVAKQLENRVTFRRAMKQAMTKVMRAGAKGVKIMVAGRLGGADIARNESYHDGTIPLATLRADIDYGFAEAATTYGRIGVKVWIYKGEVLPVKRNKRGVLSAAGTSAGSYAEGGRQRAHS
ncbi:MAG: 30S ribosomal protein S3 [Clostridiales bacterium]|jgi:small subunit ribosomal protein S3|nr:30S ribosomal protein S3 [Clostridiales bacterium]